MPRPTEIDAATFLTLSFLADVGLFVGWPRYDAEGQWRRRNFPVPRRAVREAEANGWAEPLTSSAAYVFRADEIERFLAVHRDVEPRPSSLIPQERSNVTDRVMGISARDDRERKFPYSEQLDRFELPDLEQHASALPPEPKVVETGFADPSAPNEPLVPSTVLRPGSDYLFLFGIGAEMRNSIELEPILPPEGVPADTNLTVSMFQFAGELELTGPTSGEVVLTDSGASLVSRAAARPHGVDSDLLRRALFFSVRVPAEVSGEMRMRCNLYLGATLLQSRLVSCRTGIEGEADEVVLRSEIDFALTSVLDPYVLHRAPRHELSLLVNGSQLVAPKTHEFHFFGSDGRSVSETASLPEGKIKTAIEVARRRLRQASWGKGEEWVNEGYRYEFPIDLAQFEADLISLATGGARLFTNIAGTLTGEGGVAALRDAVRRPGRIQIASIDNGLYLPAGLFYDHPLENTIANESELRLCDSFLAASGGGVSLENSACFTGDCPSYADSTVVCPSGFWGFRHEIGWPVGLSEPVREINLDGRDPAMTIGISTDKKLKLRATHIVEVGKLAAGVVAESRAEFAQLARQNDAQVVYFYCHGGYAEPEAFLVLGPPGSAGLDRGFLQREKISWDRPGRRPLVFINGCETTRVDPETLGGLVDGFVREANALGVIGTEITIFEPLAVRFGLLTLNRFLDGSRTIGAAIRQTRLELLRERNPLGLVYVPFVAADTRLML